MSLLLQTFGHNSLVRGQWKNKSYWGSFAWDLEYLENPYNFMEKPRPHCGAGGNVR